MRTKLTQAQVKESKRIAALKWYNNNKEKQRAYKEANKAKYQAYRLKWKQARIDDVYTVYFIPEHFYLGYSKSPRLRMLDHNAIGKDTTNWQVIDTFETKREAVDLERTLQDAYKFNGKNQNLK
tara:strand:+ start:49 stop:420 length:372 start_codon:yes stop_codon:yes gene_type:complete